MNDITLHKLESLVVRSPADLDRRRVYADALEEMDRLDESYIQRQIVERKLLFTLPRCKPMSFGVLGRNSPWPHLCLTKDGLLHIYWIAGGNEHRYWPDTTAVRTAIHERYTIAAWPIRRFVDMRDLVWRVRRGDISLALADCMTEWEQHASEHRVSPTLLNAHLWLSSFAGHDIIARWLDKTL